MTFNCSMPGCPMTTGGCPLCHSGIYQWPVYELPPTPIFVPPGCICPPTSEKTCQNPLCPRKGITSRLALNDKESGGE